MKNLVIGVLAHVDAGKTTLSESMLYLSGSIRKLGRVDHKDAFLDTYDLERARGITIFSKQAVFSLEDTRITLLDTPGHVDFSAEMERTLQVLDYGILIISGADGIQGHTKTLWRLLRKYDIPVFIFINKMDQSGTDRDAVLQELKKHFSSECIDFGQGLTDGFYEEVAMSEDQLVEEFLENGMIEESEIKRLICERKIFPCYFGSALKLEGVEEFLAGINQYTSHPMYPENFGAKVYKISRDDQGNRLTHLKVTGGTLKVKSIITDTTDKVNNIRIYSGVKFDTVNEAEAGTICAVTGLTTTHQGQGLGIEEASGMPILSPVLTYEVRLPEGCDPSQMLPKLQLLEEEVPELHIEWIEATQSIQAQIMGEVQTEVLKTMINERFGVAIEFGTGSIVYKETIENVVEGVGHFEPLRHYAEVHLLMEPLEAGSGLQFECDCNEDELNRNWQRLIMTHLEEREHKGVLTGSPITDMRITLVAGKAHIKHTEGGDFRQATYRAVRQGLKEAKSVLLEPYYEFRLEIPQNTLGRAMTDLERMSAKFEVQQNSDELSVICGIVPVAALKDYQIDVIAYTKGHGKLSTALKGYGPCHNAEEVIAQKGYDSERDLSNPTGSVFCSHGSGFLVDWDQVKKYMHVESCFSNHKHSLSQEENQIQSVPQEEWIDVDEIDRIIERTFYSNRKTTGTVRPGKPKKRWVETYTPVVRQYNKVGPLEEYLLVDGYNIIYANKELKELGSVNMDSASGKLMDILCNYQGYKKCQVIVVFDAYRIVGHETEFLDYHNIHVVYTKEAETADQFIEKFAHQNSHRYQITVATSDGIEQIIIRSKGCALLSARDFWKEIERVNQENRQTMISQQNQGKNYLFDSVTGDIAEQIEQIRQGNNLNKE